MSINKKEMVVSNLNDAFNNDSEEVTNSYVGKRLRRMIESSPRDILPPFPKQIQIETTNICNHSCSFCAYTTMERPKRHINRQLFERIVNETYELGAREVGLFAGAEPLTCKWLDEYIAYCSKVGFEYIYISTNGSLGGEEKFERLISAGLSSIKFSINAGDRETYKKVHGRDEFDKVLENVKFVSKIKEKLDSSLWVGVSFVGMKHTEHTFSNLKDILDGVVDEIIYYEASNQSGQMPELPDPPYRDCHLPFNKAHFSLEGYIKACCNDYENFLAVEDINKMNILDAWRSDNFQELRRKHLADKLEGTLCYNCIRNSRNIAKPINEELV